MRSAQRLLAGALLAAAWGASAPKPVVAQDPDYVLSVEDQAIPPSGTFQVAVILDSLAGEELTAWSYSVCHDPAHLTVLAAETSDTVQTLNGNEPEFENYVLFPDSYHVGVAYLGTGLLGLPPSLGPLSIGTYTHALDPGEATTLSVCPTVFPPPIPVTVVLNLTGESLSPVTIPGTPTVQNPWIRGDINDDGVVDIGDGVFLLNELFHGGVAGTCTAAKDTNRDGVINLTDVLFLFDALFLDGPLPFAPYPECEVLLGDCALQTSCQ